MAGIDADEVLVSGATSRLYLAPVGSTAPTNHSSAPDAAFIDIGYVKDPPKIRRDRTTVDIEAWNEDDPIRTVLDKEKNDFTVKLMQVTNEALKLYYRGGTTATAGTGKKFTPAGTDQERAMVLDVIDGSNVFRLYVARLQVVSVGELSFPKANTADMEITFRRLAPSSGDAELVFTNLPGVT